MKKRGGGGSQRGRERKGNNRAKGKGMHKTVGHIGREGGGRKRERMGKR